MREYDEDYGLTSVSAGTSYSQPKSVKEKFIRLLNSWGWYNEKGNSYICPNCDKRITKNIQHDKKGNVVNILGD